MFKDIINESIVIDEMDLFYKFDEWERKSGKNVLLITGLIASGKTTMAGNFASRYNAKILELDNFESHHTGYDRTGTIKAFLEKNPKIKEHFDSSWTEISMSEFSNIMNDFFKFAIEKLHNDGNNLYIIEGIQLFCYINHDEVIRNPIVIKGTSFIKAQYRMMNRRAESKDQNTLRVFMDEIRQKKFRTFKINLADEKYKLSQLREKVKSLIVQDKKNV
jgi:dephospho-CoA kinase